MAQSNYRNSASFGKRQEFVVIAELLGRGFDVYLTLVDDQGIDCVVRLDQDHYLDIQIKARSKRAQQDHRFAAMTITPRDNYYFIFYLETEKEFWVMPSKEVIKQAYQNQSGKNTGKYSLNIPKKTGSTKAKIFNQFKGQNGFDLLREGSL